MKQIIGRLKIKPVSCTRTTINSFGVYFAVMLMNLIKWILRNIPTKPLMSCTGYHFEHNSAHLRPQAASTTDKFSIHTTLLENSWKFLIYVGTLRPASKVGKTKLIGNRIAMEFNNKSFWKFTTAVGIKVSDGRLFFF